MSEQTMATQQESIITVTPLAVEKIGGLLAEKELTDHGLRVFVSGGGCSGMQYGMAFEGNPRESDTIVEVGGIKVIVDPVSLPYLQGSCIDFVDNLMGGGFAIDNPNAVSSCGCGHSFRTADGEESTGHQHGGGCSC
jgi:iron-sulfur cluster assembly protein